MSAALGGALLGGVAGSAVVTTAARLRLAARLTLDDRVAPYLRDLPSASPLTHVRTRRGREPLGGAETAGLAQLRRAAHGLDALLGGSASVRQRVGQLGRGSVEQVRVEQVLWGGAAVALTLALGLARAAVSGGTPALGLAVLAAAAGLGGALARDRHLTRQVAGRRRRIATELPTVAELVALAVGAGEGVAAALDRVGRTCRGELGRELTASMAMVRAGTPVAHALQDMAGRLELVPVRRFVEGVVVALERGTPLASVLRAQAVDAREVARRDLVERAARREVLMMLPVVFLVLPTSVVFALFPGFYGLSMAA